MLHASFENKEQAIQDAFDQVAALRSGLVALREPRSFVPPLTESLSSFYTLSGSTFRSVAGSVPSPFVISYTVEQLRRQRVEDEALDPLLGSVDLALYQVLLEKCAANAMVFQRRLEKRWE